MGRDYAFSWEIYFKALRESQVLYGPCGRLHWLGQWLLTSTQLCSSKFKFIHLYENFVWVHLLLKDHRERGGGTLLLQLGWSVLIIVIVQLFYVRYNHNNYLSLLLDRPHLVCRRLKNYPDKCMMEWKAWRSETVQVSCTNQLIFATKDTTRKDLTEMFQKQNSKLGLKL